MPWFEVDGASIYDRLHEPLFHLIFFFDGKNEMPPADNLMEEWKGRIATHTFPLFPHVAEIFGTKQSFLLTLRPDNYVGLIAENLSPETVRNYLNLISR